MAHQHYGHSRTTLKAIARKDAVKSGTARRFQVDLEPKGILSGEELIAELAKYGFDNEPIRAETALLTIEKFIEKKLSEGYQIKGPVPIKSEKPEARIEAHSVCRNQSESIVRAS